MTYHVFTEESPEKVALSASPSSVWIITVLEVAVQHVGRRYLLMMHPSYPIAGQANNPDHDEGYWAPPFVAHPVPMSYSPPTTVGSLLRLVNEAAERADIEQHLEHLCYQMGLRDTRLVRRSSFLELKVSPRSPNLVKAYHIIRYGLVDMDEATLRNLADPDQRRGYVYFPLDRFDESTEVRWSESHGRNERWFLGKPLMSNLEHVLADEMRRLAIAEHGLELRHDLFVREESGVLCVADLSGYGRALEYALNAMHTFSRSATDAQDEFRRRITEEFHTMLGDLGTTEVQLAGDGFVAAFPARVFPDVMDVSKRIVDRWSRLTGILEELNTSIREPTQRVGSRIVLHHGSYTYGRIAGPPSFAAAFDGSTVIEAVRLEQGLAAAAKSAEGIPGLPPGQSHLLALSTELVTRFAGKPKLSVWRPVGPMRLAAKEFEGTAHVLFLNSCTTPS